MDAKKVIKYVVFVVVVGNLALMAYVFLSAASPKPAPMPNPNGYDDFVKAGLMLKCDSFHWSSADAKELRALVTTNADALKLARSGLEKACKAPVDYSAYYVLEHQPEWMTFRQLSHNFCAQGRLAKIEGRTNESIESYLQAIQLGISASQGGVMVVKLLGMGCEYDGRKGLEEWKGNLDSEECKKVVNALEVVAAKEEPFEAFWRNERAWAHKAAGLREQVEDLLDFKSRRAFKSDLIQQFRTNQFKRNQMMLAFAARAYELDKGKPSSSATDLVPEYLKKIPQDPVTGTNLIWQP